MPRRYIPVAEKQKRTLPAALRANLWQPGQSGNPTGYRSEYGRMLSLARSLSHDALQRQIELAELDQAHRDKDGNLLPLSSNADPRLVAVATNSIIERAWGRPKDYDPSTEKPQSGFDPSLFTPDQLNQIDAALRLIIEVRDRKAGTTIEGQGLANPVVD